jgi:hypothetical protein
MFDESEINEAIFEESEMDEERIKKEEEKKESLEVKEYRKKILDDLKLIHKKLNKCKKFQFNHYKIYLLYQEIFNQFEKMKRTITNRTEMKLFNIYMNRFMDLKEEYDKIRGTEL